LDRKSHNDQIDNLKLFIETNQMIVEKMRTVLADLQDRIDETKAQHDHIVDSDLTRVARDVPKVKVPSE